MTAEIGIAAIAALVGITLVAFFASFGLRMLLDYRIGNDGIEFVVLWKHRILTIRYEDLEEVSTMSFMEGYTRPGWRRAFALRAGNRFRRVVVEVVRRRGLFRYIVITPEDPPTFVAEVNQRIDQSHLREKRRKA